MKCFPLARGETDNASGLSCERTVQKSVWRRTKPGQARTKPKDSRTGGRSVEGARTGGRSVEGARTGGRSGGGQRGGVASVDTSW